MNASVRATIQCCADISAVMIGHLAEHLAAKAAENGGQLSAEALQAEIRRFLDEGQLDHQADYYRSYDSCTKERELRQGQNLRRHPFDRIVTKRFAHLFLAAGGGARPVLSRRMLPGYMVALDRIVGPAVYEQCQRKSQDLMDRYRVGNGGADWERVFADPDGDALANDVLVLIAHFFGQFERRRDWFIATVNERLGPANAGAWDETWLMDHASFAEMVRALFADLDKLLTAFPDTFLSRYGEHSADAVRELLAAI